MADLLGEVVQRGELRMDGRPFARSALPGLAQHRIKLDLAPGNQCEHEQSAEYTAGDQGEGDDHVLGQYQMKNAARQGEDEETRG